MVVCVFTIFAASTLFPPVVASASAASSSRQDQTQRQGSDDVGHYDDDENSYGDDGVAAPNLRQPGQQQQQHGEEAEEDEYEDPPHDDDASDRAGAAAAGDVGAEVDDELEAAAGVIDMTTPDYLAEHEGAVLNAEAEAEYAREMQEAGLELGEARELEEEAQVPAEKRLMELEDKLYFGNLTVRNVREGFRGLFEFVAGAPTLEEAREMKRVLAGGATEARLAEARKKLAQSQADILRAFGVGEGTGTGEDEDEDGGGQLQAGEDAITLEEIPGDEGKLNIKFNFKLVQGTGKAATKAQAIFRALGAAPPAAAGEDEVELMDEETQQAVDAVREAIRNALQAKQTEGVATAAARDQSQSQSQAVEADDNSPPEDWDAISDALYLLAALVEAGIVPPDAFPEPPPGWGRGHEPSSSSSSPAGEGDEATTQPPTYSSSFTVADYSAGWSARPMTDDGVDRHPAATHPEWWARKAMLVSAEMGSTEARLAMGNRILHGRGSFTEAVEGPNCELALDWIRPVADQAAKDAEASGDFQLPRQPGRLRERERDASWVSEEELENGDEQITMEEDMAARGVPEAQRHIGYRRLVGRGMDRDEAAALREFEAAAGNGDELAAFNLGYMHMKGLSVPQNFTEARKRFDAAIAKELPAAYNGIGVLHFNGWGTERNYTAARLAFEAGAERGDPDSHFNLGALYSSGLGVDRDQEKAVKCYEAASQAGHWRAPHVLAIAHQTGNGTPRNCTRAAQLFKVFIEERLGWTRDQEEAMAVLDGGPVADVNDEGSSDKKNVGTSSHTVPSDPWSALVRYTLLAEKGSESATSNAAWMLTKGLGYGGSDNMELAERMHERSLMLGNKEAHVDLGDIKWNRLISSRGGPKLSPPVAAVEVEEAVAAEVETGDAGAGVGVGRDDTQHQQHQQQSGAEDEGAQKKLELEPEPPRPLKPPPGATREEEIAFHYAEAAHAGYAEGTVNLAWAHAHGVGVPRNLSHASELLYGAYLNSPTEVEALAPLLAYVGVKIWSMLESVANAMGLGRVLSELVSYGSSSRTDVVDGHADDGAEDDDATMTSTSGGSGKDPRVAGAGGYPTEEMAGSGAAAAAGGVGAEEGTGTPGGGGGGGIAAESGRKPKAAWMPHAYPTVENVLLGVLLFMAVLVGYTRLVVMERPDAAAAAAEVVQEVPLAALAGAGAAVATTIGICIAVFAGVELS